MTPCTPPKAHEGAVADSDAEVSDAAADPTAAQCAAPPPKKRTKASAKACITPKASAAGRRKTQQPIITALGATVVQQQQVMPPPPIDYSSMVSVPLLVLTVKLYDAAAELAPHFALVDSAITSATNALTLRPTLGADPTKHAAEFATYTSDRVAMVKPLFELLNGIHTSIATVIADINSMCDEWIAKSLPHSDSAAVLNSVCNNAASQLTDRVIGCVREIGHKVTLPSN